MSVYRFNHGSTVSEIVMRTSASGGVRSFVHAKEDATPEDLSQIKALLTKQGWQHMASEYEGKPCLEVRGLRKITPLQTALLSAGFIQGNADISTNGDIKFSITEKMRNNMLLACGILNVIADIGFIGYGHLKQKLPAKANEPAETNKWEDKFAGYAYSAGSLELALFGGGDRSRHHIRDIVTKFQRQLESDGVAIPEGGVLAALIAGHQQKPANGIYDFLHKHCSEIYNGLTGTAGVFIFKGALKSSKPHTRLVDGILGAATMAGGYGAAAVKEKAPDAIHPPSSLLGKARKWLQERPNRIAAFGYMISTLAHAYESISNFISAAKDYSKPADVKLAKWAYGLRAAFTAINLAAEGVLSLASKGHGDGVKSDSNVDDIIYAMVADTILRQPQEQQEQRIVDWGRNFLARPDVLGGEPDAVEATSRTRLNNLLVNPWSGMEAPASALAVPSAKEQSPEKRRKMADLKAQAAEKWQEIVTPQTKTGLLAHAM